MLPRAPAAIYLLRTQTFLITFYDVTQVDESLQIENGKPIKIYGGMQKMWCSLLLREELYMDEGLHKNCLS